MNPRSFLKTVAATAPLVASTPFLNLACAQDRGKVKITDVKVMRIRERGMFTYIKVETDAGVYGIGGTPGRDRTWRGRLRRFARGGWKTPCRRAITKPGLN